MHHGQEGQASPSWPWRARTEILLAGPPSEARIDVSRHLRDAGYRVSPIAAVPDGDGEPARRPISQLVVFVGPPSADALDLCAQLRRRFCALLVAYTEASSDEVVTALDAGADDVIVMPVLPAELLARVGVAMRYREALAALAASEVLELPGLRIDLVARSIDIGGVAIDVPAHEFELLSLLARHAGTVLETGALVERIWPGAPAAGRSRLRVCATRLRKRLGAHPGAPVVVADRGVGYALVLRRDGS